VNWFRRDASGKFIWPGYGENLRVLRWVLERCQNQGDAVRTPIGYLPGAKGIDTTGLDLSADARKELTSVDPGAWLKEIDEVDAYFNGFGNRLPQELAGEVTRVRSELRQSG
jgi:phosphoenolpyruvate carboxykinase (GTP)